MFREYETTIDNQGHFDISADMRERKGLKNGTRIKIKEHDADLVVQHIIEDSETSEDRKARQYAAIEAAIGILPKDSKALEHLMEERKKDRERENRPFGI